MKAKHYKLTIVKYSKDGTLYAREKEKGDCKLQIIGNELEENQVIYQCKNYQELALWLASWLNLSKQLDYHTHYQYDINGNEKKEYTNLSIFIDVYLPKNVVLFDWTFPTKRELLK
jgi:hypothetical protein